MNKLEGDEYANFYWSEYQGPTFLKCKCGTFNTRDDNVKDGDTCEECDRMFLDVTDSECWEYELGQRDKHGEDDLRNEDFLL